MQKATYKANTKNTEMPGNQAQWATSSALITLGKAYNPKAPVNGVSASAKCNYTAHKLVCGWLAEAGGPLPAKVLYSLLVQTRNHGCYLPWRGKAGTYVLAKPGESCGTVPSTEKVAPIAKLA